ncbi:CheY-like superfamily [Penicillium bovifimosum]|uniref:histidine kinase n=1 Tax=Penicillium bovifimosum TaxID=126998 RepID=A0A9W9L2G7_9EURO|nr:CheY-like superfamily [Penicillium bovifimosum]KAJ5135210.1 CheY-like superfamily [Penicillium bovifimosum]
MNDSDRQLCDYQADRQTREVYRYFQPGNPAVLNATSEFDEHVASTADLSRVPIPGVPDASSSETNSTEASAPSSPNTTLTSFAQLAALRLNAQRAFITILNTDSQFILAEATRNTNIGSSTSPQGEEDELLTGTSTLSSAWNICQQTVAIDSQDGVYPFLIVNDLQEEGSFSELPFVKQAPHSRFYAGTPLTSDSGINLGCLFVLDSEPRDGLSDIEKGTLGRVAEMVMDYLLVSRQAIEGRRASRLSRGLHLFVDGNSSFASNARMSSPSISSGRSVSPGLLSRCSHPRGRRSARSEPSDSGRPTRSEGGEVTSQDRIPSLSPEPNQSEISAPTSAADSIQDSQRSNSISGESSGSNHWLFQRAANLLRQSLDLDGAGGVMFLGVNDNTSEYVADGHDSSEPADHAPILAFSTRNDPFSYQASSTLSDPAVNLDNDFLKQLTRRYPKGRLWSFHRDGTFSTAEEQSANESQKQRKKSRPSETSKLNDFFPEASQVMFVPLWNATDSQWFAGCFCWTPQPTRVFSQAVDLSSIFAFGSSIMTEYSRVESVIADRQKGDFISSISHELRSPLHGVLAGAEFMSSTNLDQYQDTLLDTINACGRTLLDTMNQVLDFSKIMSLERHKKIFKRGKDPWKSKPPEDHVTRLDPLVSTDVSLLIEDVVESVCLGHSHSTISSTRTSPHAVVSSDSHSHLRPKDDEIEPIPEVDVVVDIPDNAWMYKVQPGSLRRLVMNILGNSLKYTSKGQVCISIETTERNKTRSRHQGLEDMVTLTVSDTGKGISKEYLRKHLFTPFAQEDTLSVGTGLGLSIVRGIVKTLNGKIKIRSRQGKGTTVKVSLPLERSTEEKSSEPTFHEGSPDREIPKTSSQVLRGKLTDKRAAIWGVDPSDLGQYPFWASIARYMTDWYGLQLVSLSDNQDVDILFADERDLSSKDMRNFPTGLPNLLVFCGDSSSYCDPREKWAYLTSPLTILHRPCGPQKLGRAILNCLNPKPASPVPQPQDLTDESVLPERLAAARPAVDPSDPTGKPCDSMDPAGHNPAASSRPEMPGHSLSSSSTLLSTGPGYSGKSPGRTRPRVLVVDDNSINLHLLVTFLDRRRLVVLDKAENGRAAVDAVERMLRGYDLIFMDLSMPVMDGFEATRAIRAIEKEREGCVPATIIAFTGLSSSRDETKALDSGVDVFLTKPVSFKAVSRLIDDWDRKHLN